MNDRYSMERQTAAAIVAMDVLARRLRWDGQLELGDRLSTLADEIHDDSLEILMGRGRLRLESDSHPTSIRR